MTEQVYRWFKVINTEGLDSEAKLCLNRVGLLLPTTLPDLVVLQFPHTTPRPSVHVFRQGNLEERMYCQCGCMNPVPRAKHTYRRYGYHKGDYVRYLPGHNNRHYGLPGETSETDPNPSGTCRCGCGNVVAVVDARNRCRRYRFGWHRTYLRGHNFRVVAHQRRQRPYPPPTCQCGHPLTGDNVRLYEKISKRRWDCRVCQRLRNGRSRARRRAAKQAARLQPFPVSAD